MPPTARQVAKMIDHALLHLRQTDEDIAAGCALAARYDVAAACVKPCSVPACVEHLRGSEVAICAVAGFPHGNGHTATIVAEARRACREGATEIDIVTNTGKVIGEDWDYVAAEIREVNDAVVGEGAILKVIFENDFLEEAHIVRLCEICSEIGVAFIKTSTGFGFVKRPEGGYHYRGARPRHIDLMRAHAAPSVEIKAAGGIRTLDELLTVRELGATRIGTSSTEKLIEEARERFG